jgi:hypothetical protein
MDSQHQKRGSDIYDVERHTSPSQVPTSNAVDDNEIEEEHKDILLKRNLVK